MFNFISRQFQHTKLRTRLFLSFGLMIVFILSIGTFALFQLHGLSELTAKLYHHPFAVTNTIRKVNINLAEMRSSMKDVALAKDDLSLQESVDSLNMYDQEVYDHFKTIKERFLGDQQDVDALIKLFDEWHAIRQDIIAQKKAGKHEEAMSAITSGAGAIHFAKIQEAMKVISQFADNKAKDFFDNAQFQKNQALYWLSLAFLIVTTLGISVMWLMSRAITRPLQEAVAMANTIASGDFTKELEGTEDSTETGQLLQALVKMQRQLREIILVIKQTAEIVTTSAQEISQGNGNLSQRTTEQASSLQETAASMEEMTSSVQQNSDNTKQAAQLALSARNHATQGGEVVNAAIHAINDISRSSQQITEIISVINEIAFQTNLLALNAAVEAARAGEQGRGFAVVASEVRNLAQRSAAAAKEIKSLIQDSVTKVAEGTKLANKSGESLTEIVNAVKKVSDIIAEIAAASQEQASSINQVHRAVTQLDEVTQHNAAMVEEIASASVSMTTQAETLKQQVAFFKIGELEMLPQEVAKGRQTTRPASSSAPVIAKQRSSHHDASEWQDF